MRYFRKRDKLHSGNGGYSLIELVIVLAIIAVLMSGVFYSIILVFSANAKSCANDIQNAISDCKVKTMGKSDAYMEFYRTDSGYYTKMYITEPDGSVTEEEPQKVGTNRVNVGFIPGEGDGNPTADPATPLDAGNPLIMIHFDRASGSFIEDKDGKIYKAITVQGGSKNYQILLTKLTGKTQVVAQ